eukprot:2330133-Prymnesium_polylepis.1
MHVLNVDKSGQCGPVVWSENNLRGGLAPRHGDRTTAASAASPEEAGHAHAGSAPSGVQRSDA